VDGTGNVDHVHAVAEALGVPTQVVVDAASSALSAGSRGRTQAVATSIVTVLQALPAHRGADLPLARVGHAVGLWGPVFQVRGTRTRSLRRLPWLRVNDFDP